MVASATTTRKEKAPRKQRTKKEKHIDSDSDDDCASDVRILAHRNYCENFDKKKQCENETILFVCSGRGKLKLDRKWKQSWSWISNEQPP